MNESSNQRVSDWRRFSYWDVVGLMFGAAIAYPFHYFWYYHMRGTGPEPSPIIKSAMFLAMAFVFSGPCVLFSQRYMRGRLTGLSRGERLWVTLAAFWLVAYAGLWSMGFAISYMTHQRVIVSDPHPGVLMAIVFNLVWLLAHLYSTVEGIKTIRSECLGKQIDSEHIWTSCVGSVSVTTASLLMINHVVFYMPGL